MTAQDITIAVSILTVVSGAINVYVGLRLAALQAQIKADSAAAEIALVKQFVEWKDDMLQLLNGKYVTATLVGEIRTGITHDVARIDKVLDRIERRCEERTRRLHLPSTARTAARRPGVIAPDMAALRPRDRGAVSPLRTSVPRLSHAQPLLWFHPLRNRPDPPANPGPVGHQEANSLPLFHFQRISVSS